MDGFLIFCFAIIGTVTIYNVVDRICTYKENINKNK
jgi:hypothetical protein